MVKKTGADGLISFDVELEPDPAVSSLLSSVGARIGKDRLSRDEQKARAKWKKKEAARKKSGLVRVTIDIRPETKADLHLLAASLKVTASQVADMLLEWAMSQEREGNGPRLQEYRKIDYSSRRYEFMLDRGAPKKSEGHPSKNRGAPLGKAEGHPSKNKGAPLTHIVEDIQENE